MFWYNVRLNLQDLCDHHMCLLQPPGYPKSDKGEFLPYWVDVQADLSLCWSHRSYCMFFRALSWIFSRCLVPDLTRLWSPWLHTHTHTHTQIHTHILTHTHTHTHTQVPLVFFPLTIPRRFFYWFFFVSASVVSLGCLCCPYLFLIPPAFWCPGRAVLRDCGIS